MWGNTAPLLILIRPTMLPVSFQWMALFSICYTVCVFVCVVYRRDSCWAQMCNSTEYGAIQSHTNTLTPSHTHTHRWGVVVWRYLTTSWMVLLLRSSNHPGSRFTPSQRLLASNTQHKRVPRCEPQTGSSSNIVWFIFNVGFYYWRCGSISERAKSVSIPSRYFTPLSASWFSWCGQLHPSGAWNEDRLPFDPGLFSLSCGPVCAEKCQTVSEVSAPSLERHSLSRFFCPGSALVSTDLAGADKTLVLRLNLEQPTVIE